MRRRPPGAAHRKPLGGRAGGHALPAAVPLVHVTAVGIAEQIVHSRQLETRFCNKLGRNLLYFFALKPAYGMKQGDEKSHQINRFPFAFVVSPEAVKNPFHVYPFDTGAALDTRYTAADPYLYLEDYELAPTHAAVIGQIGWAFGSLEAYYDGDLRPDLLDDVPVHDVVPRGFVDIARMASPGSNQADARAASIEIACSHHVRLKDVVLLAVIPRAFLEGEGGDQPNTDFVDQLDALNIPYDTYDWQPNRSPDDYREEIAHIVKAFYSRPGRGKVL